MARIGNDLCRDFEKPVLVDVGDLHEGLRKALELQDEGVEVFISRGGTAKLIRERLSAPVVEIKVSAYDILEAFQKIPPGAKRIGIIGFENVIYGSWKLGSPLGLDLRILTIQKKEEVPLKLSEAESLLLDVIVGDNIVVSQAALIGRGSVLIESGHESILQSFLEAYEILAVVRAEADKARKLVTALNQLKEVLNAVDEQLVILDSEDRIQSCNPAALQMFRKEEKDLVGAPLFLYPGRPLKIAHRKDAAVRDHICTVRGHHLLLDYLPIGNSDERSGTLVVARSVKKLEQSERKVRSELHLKGHVVRFSFNDIITDDKIFNKNIEIARKYASSSSTVLILGETGTGKEMLAQSIHNQRFGSDRPFVAINCATLPESLLESELFGYAPGAFTGAKKQRKKGFFELAHGGTLLLDEIAELPINLQSRLLRVIEQREVLPLGDDRVIPVDVHIIASTNKNLAVELKERRFRDDLFYRLNVLQLQVPPLRERGKDPMRLFAHFVHTMNPGCDARHFFTPAVEKILCNYPWPGNVRELRNLVERLSTITERFVSPLDDLGEWLLSELESTEPPPGENTREKYDFSLRQVQHFWVKRLCDNSSMTQEELAKVLGISRTTLWKLRKHN